MTDLRLHLVRHEEADPDSFGPDAHRALTGRGRRRLRQSARAFAAREGTVDALYTSPLVRAVQTAEVLADALGLDDGVEVRAELGAPPSLGALARLADQAPANVRSLMLVGHEPALGALLAHFLDLPSLGRGVRTGAIFTVELTRGRRPARLISLQEPDGPLIEGPWW
jgi:phosphohistidine phosphatase